MIATGLLASISMNMLYSLPSTITARSPLAMLFGVRRRRLQLLHSLLGQLFEIVPAKCLDDCVGAGQAGAAVTGMRFDELAFPFRIEKVEIAGRRILGRHQGGVVAHHAQRRTPCCVIALRILELRGIRFTSGGVCAASHFCCFQ